MSGTTVQKFTFTRKFEFNGQVDVASGVITGVAACTVGEAKGHGLFVDLKFLQQLKNLAEARTNKRVRSGADHWSGIKDTAGYCDNWVIDGQTLRCDFNLLENEEAREKLCEMALKIPDEFGFSVSFEGEPEEIGRVYYARAENFISNDLVTQPAANPGLFKEKAVTNPPHGVDTGINNMTGDEIQAHVENAIKPHVAKMETAHAELKGHYDGLCTRLAALEAHSGMKDGKPAKEKEGDDADEPANDEPMAAINKLRADFDARVAQIQENTLKTLGKGKIAIPATPVLSTPAAADPTPTPAPGGEPAKETFEDIFQKNIDQGMSRSDAMGSALEAHPDLHANYIERFNSKGADGKPLAKPLSAYKAKAKTV